MTDKDYVTSLFDRVSHDYDIAVIEGVMGLFDGASPISLEGSTAQIANWLNAPVILVCNSHGTARSLAATVKGYDSLEEDISIDGVIANFVVVQAMLAFSLILFIMRVSLHLLDGLREISSQNFHPDILGFTVHLKSTKNNVLAKFLRH